MEFQEKVLNSGIKSDIISMFIEDYGGTMARIFEPSSTITLASSERLRAVHSILEQLDFSEAEVMGTSIRFFVERTGINPEFYLSTSFIFSNTVGNTDFTLMMEPEPSSQLLLPDQKTLQILGQTYITGLQSL